MRKLAMKLLAVCPFVNGCFSDQFIRTGRTLNEKGHVRIGVLLSETGFKIPLRASEADRPERTTAKLPSAPNAELAQNLES
jgi:hypothetical protein